MTTVDFTTTDISTADITTTDISTADGATTTAMTTPGYDVVLTGPGDVSEDSGSAVFTLTRTASFQALTVNVAVAGSGTNAATAGTDFTTPPATVTFPSGSHSITINVPIVDDGTIEYSEELTMTVSASGGIATVTATASITNDDAYTITATSDSPVTEGSTATITITRDSGVDSLTLAFTTADGSAVSPADYADGAGSVTFADGDTTMMTSVTANGDATYEAQEAFTWKVTAAPLVTGSALNPLTINIDDSPSETITISGATSVNEDGTSAVYTFTRDNTDRATTISYEVVPNAILPGESHNVQAVAATNLAFAVGADVQTITVTLIDDSMKETAKGFEIRATGTLVTINQPYVVSIVDDDGYLVTFSDETIAEGESKEITFTRDSPVDSFTINVASASGTATSGTDFPAVNSDVTFAPGSNTVTVMVVTTEDTNYEADETFTLTVTSTGILKGTPPFTQTVTITDDYLVLTGPGDVSEDSGSAVFTLTRTASFQALTVNVAVAGSGTNAATAGTDFTAPPATATFPSGSHSITINVPIVDDGVIEYSEELTMTVTASGRLPRNATATITNDDADVVTITQFLASQENGDNTVVIIYRTVSDKQVTVKVNTGAVSATADSDYTTLSDHEVTFLVGSLEATFVVAIIDDTSDEDDETFTLQVSGDTVITSPLYTFTIVDNEGVRAFDCHRLGQGCPAATDICHPELPDCQCIGAPAREGKMCNVITGQMSGAACAGKDCNNNGVCLENAGVISCACNPGYYGDDCEYFFLKAICTATDLTFIADPVGTFTGRIYVKDKQDVPACTANPLPSPPSNLAGVTDDNTRGFYMVVPHNSADCGPISPIEGVTKTYYERQIFIQYLPGIVVGIDQRVTVACQFDRNNPTVATGVITVDFSDPIIDDTTGENIDPFNVGIYVNDIGIGAGSQVALNQTTCLTMSKTGNSGGLEILDISFHNNKASQDDKSWLLFEDECVKPEANVVMAQLPHYSNQVSKRTVEYCFFAFKFEDSAELRVQTTVKICDNAADCDQQCTVGTVRRKRQAATTTRIVNATFNIVEKDGQTETPSNRTVVSSLLEYTTPHSFLPTVISMGVVLFLLILICIYLTYRLCRRSAKKAQREVETTMPQHPVMFLRSHHFVLET